MANYGEEYFTTGNYVDYLHRRERYHKLAQDVDAFLDTVLLRKIVDPVLDFGCGPGFFVEGLRKRGWTKVRGYDISLWAAWHAEDCGIDSIGNAYEVAISRKYHLTIMLDVLEHLDRDEIDRVLDDIETDYLLVRIPVAVEVNGEFYLTSARNDPTHITCLTKLSWCELLGKWGYMKMVDINLPNIWDSKGVMCTLFRKV